jgi:hypothetical protein
VRLLDQQLLEPVPALEIVGGAFDCEFSTSTNQTGGSLFSFLIDVMRGVRCRP